MSVSLQKIFAEHFPAYAATRRLSPDMWRMASLVTRCRTASLGAHVVRCPNGHQKHIAYHSCRHRSCPQCALLPREKWLAGWKTRLLDCPHHHVVFTVPHELNALWRFNKKTFAESLFQAATDALAKLLADPKYLGATPGMLAALHTWSQTLAAHVHLHVLVTAGGLDREGQWRSARKSCLLPRKVLMIIFRGKFRDALLGRLERDDLVLPPGVSRSQLRGLLNKLGRQVWNVKLLERYDHGVGVATYLARYLKGGPISPHRIISDRGNRIRFRARRSNGESSDGEVRLHVSDFFQRLLQHVPPRSMQTVRGYGIYAGCKRVKLNEARAQLGQMPVDRDQAEPPTWQELCRLLGYNDAALCSTCGAELVVSSPLSARAPPRRRDRKPS